jgi:hypothetical protein
MPKLPVAMEAAQSSASGLALSPRLRPALRLPLLSHQRLPLFLLLLPSQQRMPVHRLPALLHVPVPHSGTDSSVSGFSEFAKPFSINTL